SKCPLARGVFLRTLWTGRRLRRSSRTQTHARTLASAPDNARGGRSVEVGNGIGASRSSHRGWTGRVRARGGDAEHCRHAHDAVATASRHVSPAQLPLAGLRLAGGEAPAIAPIRWSYAGSDRPR